MHWQKEKKGEVIEGWEDLLTGESVGGASEGDVLAGGYLAGAERAAGADVSAVGCYHLQYDILWRRLFCNTQNIS